MPAAFVDNAQLTFPSAASSVTLTPSGTAHVYGAWAEIAASAPSDLLLTGIDVKPDGSNNDSYVDIEIGVGPAGSEVGISTFGFHPRGLGGFVSTDSLLSNIRASIPVSGISSGDRIAARIRRGTTSAATIPVAVHAIAAPLDGDLETTAQPLQITAQEISASAHATTPWTSGAWVELIASTAAAIVINHLVARGSDSGQPFEIDIGVGAAGSEVVVATVPGQGGGWPTGTGVHELPVLFDNIAAASRVALRARSNAANTNFALRLGYYEKPL